MFPEKALEVLADQSASVQDVYARRRSLRPVVSLWDPQFSSSDLGDSEPTSLRLIGTYLRSLCAGDKHRESLGKTFTALVARPARLPVEAHGEKCGSCARQLSAVLGVVPLHTRTR